MNRGRTTRGDGGRGTAGDGPLAVYGANAVDVLLRSGLQPTRLCLGRGPRERELLAEAGRRGVRAESLDREALERLAGSPHHQGAVAILPGFPYVAVEEVLGAPSALLLDGIQDPRNLGAILRVARAAGVGGVVLPRDRSSPVTPVAVAASAGLALGLRVARVTNLARAMEALKNAGFWLIGLVPEGGTRLDRLDVPSRPALVVGSEGEGVRPLVRRGCDFLATIPMAPGVESLNVSVATGIALYEVLVRGRAS